MDLYLTLNMNQIKEHVLVDLNPFKAYAAVQVTHALLYEYFLADIKIKIYHCLTISPYCKEAPRVSLWNIQNWVPFTFLKIN